jgi:DNA-binding response OmpR family regulator
MPKVIYGIRKTQKVASMNKKKIIAIADDDTAILDAMKMMLELYDYDVETIADGEVVTKLQTVHPQLLFLDISMPGIDGRDICRLLKSHDDTRNIPIVMISARYNLEDEIIAIGADDYLAKPFDMDDLLSKVNKYLLN